MRLAPGKPGNRDTRITKILTYHSLFTIYCLLSPGLQSKVYGLKSKTTRYSLLVMQSLDSSLCQVVEGGNKYQGYQGRKGKASYGCQSQGIPFFRTFSPH